ncbi:MAG: HAD hydrolase-like protein [Candidatus Brocadiales bacterium]|nr:HAD hydrolase-like protein [Candidatus Brocadiales bacterium]
MIKVIFFDFDGVILESVDIKTNAFAELFEREGKDVVEKVVDYHLKNTGISRYEKFRYVYREILKRPLDDKEFNVLCNNFAGLVVEGVLKAPYVKGAKEFLENYTSEYKCYVVSATPQVELEEIILKRYMSHFFKSIYGAPTKKSNAVRNILMSERIDSNVAVYVGDALSDYKAAIDNFVHFIARINNNEDVFTAIDCPKVKDLTNLKAILDSM